MIPSFKAGFGLVLGVVVALAAVQLFDNGCMPVIKQGLALAKSKIWPKEA